MATLYLFSNLSIFLRLNAPLAMLYELVSISFVDSKLAKGEYFKL